MNQDDEVLEVTTLMDQEKVPEMTLNEISKELTGMKNEIVKLKKHNKFLYESIEQVRRLADLGNRRFLEAVCPCWRKGHPHPQLSSSSSKVLVDISDDEGAADSTQISNESSEVSTSSQVADTEMNMGKKLQYIIEDVDHTNNLEGVLNSTLFTDDGASKELSVSASDTIPLIILDDDDNVTSIASQIMSSTCSSNATSSSSKFANELDVHEGPGNNSCEDVILSVVVAHNDQDENKQEESSGVSSPSNTIDDSSVSPPALSLGSPSSTASSTQYWDDENGLENQPNITSDEEQHSSDNSEDSPVVSKKVESSYALRSQLKTERFNWRTQQIEPITVPKETNRKPGRPKKNSSLKKTTGSWTCTVCGRKVTSAAAQLRHPLRHQPILRDSPACKICGRRFADQILVDDHVSLKHRNRVKDWANWKKKTTSHKCSICGKIYLRKGNLKKHMEIHK